MLSLSFKKALKDLFINKRRVLLVLLAMIIGVMGVGTLLNATVILNREMNKNYMSTNPASATLWVNNLDAHILEGVKSFPGIKEVETRQTSRAQLYSENAPGKEIDLFVIPGFEDIKISTFKPETGSWPPKTGEILIERAAMKLTDADIGQNIAVKLPGHTAATLKLSGSVHAPGLPPAWMENKLYGFVTPDTFKLLGGISTSTELKIVVSENPSDKKEISKTTYKLKEWIERNNGRVVRIEIPSPGKHPHASQMQTLLFILQCFSLLTFLLSTIIVASMISAMMAQQIREIGIMKAIGARTKKIASIYLSFTFILGIISMIIAVPLSAMAGKAYAAFGAKMLNFEIISSSIPFGIYLLEILFSVLFPMLIAFFSIWKTSKTTVLNALQSYGATMAKVKKEIKYSFIPRPFLVSLRNTFRKRTRLFFTLCVLSLGGSLFLTSINISTSMNSSMLGVIGNFKYDAAINFAQNYEKEELKTKISSTAGVKDVEIWSGAEASCIHSDGLSGGYFQVSAVPSETKMLEPITPSTGRWLLPVDTNAIVVNQLILSIEPCVNLGDTIKLKMNGITSEWVIVGIVQELMSEPKAYVNLNHFNKIQGQENRGQNALVITEGHDERSVNEVISKLQKYLEAENFLVLKTESLRDVSKKITNHLMILASMLMIMSALGAVVGGMGLSTTMGINTMERLRELAIMRAIGASPKTVSRIILGEGMIIGALSCILAVIVSIPLSIFISNRFGTIFFETPMRASLSPLGIIAWSIAAVIFAALSSLSPAKRASKESIRNVLAYE